LEYQGLVGPASSITFDQFLHLVRTFQEALLSHRLIVFTNEQVYFQCRQSCSCESYPVLRDVDAPISPLDQFYEFAFQIQSFSEQESVGAALKDFTRRQLSYDADILNAFRGTLKQYEREAGVYSLFGIPIIARPRDRELFKLRHPHLHDRGLEQRFTAALTWESHLHYSAGWITGGLRDRYGEDLPRRAGFPSWSWAGWRWPQKEQPVSLLGSYYYPSIDATVYTTDGVPLAWSLIQEQLEHGILDDRTISPTITLHAWTLPIKLVRRGFWASPKGKRYDSFVDGRQLSDNIRFHPYEGKWSSASTIYTAIYFGPLPGDMVWPKTALWGPSVFFMLVKERANGNWERVGEGSGYVYNLQQFFGWSDYSISIPDVFERKKLDIC
jgi:hypothetical protein